DALFAGGVTLRDATSSLCTRGVLGSENVADTCAADPTARECGYEGDRLRIVGDPLRAESEASRDCLSFYVDEEGERSLELEMRIVRSARGELVLAPAPDFARATYERFETCYAPFAPGSGPDAAAPPLEPTQLFEYIVTAGDAFTVTGAVTSFLHRVVEDDAGVCIVDLAGQPEDPSDPSTFRFGRARLGVLFENPRVAFRLDGPPPASDDEPEFRIGGETARLVFGLDDPAFDTVVSPPGSTIFAGIDYVPGIRRLFAVDGNADRILELGVEPLRVVRTID
ncbi:MAG: hypothetical protein AAGH15_13430, partial [Myxococcota bacterium]